MTEVRPPAADSEPKQSEPPEPVSLSEDETERVRSRVRLIVEIASQIGEYRSGLDVAGKRITPSEAAVIADLERHGLDVPQLRDVLCGAHVLVDEPELYESWRFPKSRERLSSHHKTIDKKRYPDIGLKGPLVREKLHGRTQAGTWIQLEKTPAAMGHGFHLPTLTDAQHLWDYIVYRFTKSNVGPWGLSKATERRPMYLSPSLGATVPLPASAEAELTGRARADRGGGRRDVRVTRPGRPVPAARPREHVGRAGLRAGHSRRPRPVRRLRRLRHRVTVGRCQGGAGGGPDTLRGWTLPAPGRTRAHTVRAGDRELRCAVRRVPVEEQAERT